MRSEIKREGGRKKGRRGKGKIEQGESARRNTWLDLATVARTRLVAQLPERKSVYTSRNLIGEIRQISWRRQGVWGGCWVGRSPCGYRPRVHRPFSHRHHHRPLHLSLPPSPVGHPSSPHQAYPPVFFFRSLSLSLLPPWPASSSQPCQMSSTPPPAPFIDPPCDGRFIEVPFGEFLILFFLFSSLEREKKGRRLKSGGKNEY